MHRVGAGGLVLLAACDGVFGLRTVEPPDAAIDARVCTAGTPFGAGTAVPIDGAYSVEAARFSADRSRAHLSLCPASGDTTGCDLYVSQFSTTTGLFTEHDRLGGVSAVGVYDSYPTITPDGNHIIFGSRRGGSLRMWIATKSNGSFEAPASTQLALVPDEDFANEPYMLADGKTLYFAAGLDLANVDYDVYRAYGDAPTFGTAERVPGIESTFEEQAPVSSPDERELFFSSNRAGGGGPLDIFMATRDDATSPFGAVTRLEALASDGNDWAVWLSPDGCALYYISRVAGVSTLYVTLR